MAVSLQKLACFCILGMRYQSITGYVQSLKGKKQAPDGHGGKVVNAQLTLQLPLVIPN